MSTTPDLTPGADLTLGDLLNPPPDYGAVHLEQAAFFDATGERAAARHQRRLAASLRPPDPCALPAVQRLAALLDAVAGPGPLEGQLRWLRGVLCRETPLEVVDKLTVAMLVRVLEGVGEPAPTTEVVTDAEPGRPATPTAEYCLAIPGKVRWDREAKARPMLCKLLAALLGRKRWPTPYCDVEESVWGREVEDGRVRGDVSALSLVLDEVGFPWNISTRGGAIYKD